MAGLAVLLVLTGCTQGSTSMASKSPTPTAATRSPSPSPSTSPCPAASAYGLLATESQLDLITSAGCIKASAQQRPGSLQECTTKFPAVLPPAVSASTTTVYYRDGNASVRSLTPDGTTADVTTVPGDATTVSFFTVSPDDRRIAVAVEDMSRADSITESLYVEDLVGHGHHSNIYTTSFLKDGGFALFPMGWHKGNLVLALGPACAGASQVTVPTEWHVVSAKTASRLGTVPGSKIRCKGSFWQSPAGVSCAIDNTTFVMDWTPKQLRTVTRGIGPDTSALSPSGRDVALIWNAYPYAQLSPATELVGANSSQSVIVNDEAACEWIDDLTVLSSDAVIAFPSGAVTKLPASGQCAGRLPGGL